MTYNRIIFRIRQTESRFVVYEEHYNGSNFVCGKELGMVYSTREQGIKGMHETANITKKASPDKVIETELVLK